MIKISLSFFIASMMLFLMAKAFFVLSIAALTKVFFHIGALFLLAAFSLMFTGLMLNAGKQISRGILRYCSGIERRKRRLWFMQGMLDQEHRLFFHRRLQTRYFLEVKRRRLMLANDRKHSHSLARAIDSDLEAIKAQVSAELIKAWRKQNHDYRRQADIDGLIKLQQTIMIHL